MRVSEEPVGIYLFRQNPVFTTLHFKISLSCRTASAMLYASDPMDLNSSLSFRDGGYEQLISNGGRFKPAFA
jgi:hypothetical protein